MACLYYGLDALPHEVPDDVLAHLKAVVAAKLRRGESFMLTLRDSLHPTLGSTSLWIQSSIPLRFVFDHGEPETLDPDRLRTLAHAANSSRGLVLDCSSEQIPHTVHTAERLVA